jgi:hypothetical protein
MSPGAEQALKARLAQYEGRKKNLCKMPERANIGTSAFSRMMCCEIACLQR